jgi:hypothetical protein
MRGAFYILIAWIFLFGFVFIRQMKSSRQHNQKKSTGLAVYQIHDKGIEAFKAPTSPHKNHSKSVKKNLPDVKAGAGTQENEPASNLDNALQNIKSYYRVAATDSSQPESDPKQTQPIMNTTEAIKTIKNFYKLGEE